MKETFREVNLGERARETVGKCEKIIISYMNQGLRLTLRQLYYQLVSSNAIANVEKEYKRLSTVVSDGRLNGMLDWDAIEDRVRVPRMPLEFDSIQDRVKYALQNYRLPRWADQDNYVELWVEKEALAGVLAPIAHEYHITLMVNRGYSSQSAMHESAARFKGAEGKALTLLYLGDFDPSGEDMVRDIRDRLEMFGVEDLNVKKIALTWAQIAKYKPPPNPAKITDPRAAGFIQKYGNKSYEVDALPPNVLQKLIRSEIDVFVDVARM